MGVHKTRNTKHSGTCRNISENGKIKVIFMKKQFKLNYNNNIVFVKINNNKIKKKKKRKRKIKK